ncbi:hypothetical protein Q5752_002750 [Cryptotrichosporon argae]
MHIINFAALMAAGASAATYSPSGSYTPSLVACPSNHTFVYPASDGLAGAERAWLSLRKASVVAALETYLTSANITGFDVAAYITAIAANESAVPTLALTLSGGGTRAELSGLGVYQALDERYAHAVQAGTGGLLQALTYVAGLSGGAGATTALAAHDFDTLASLIANGALNLTSNDTAFDEIAGKAEAGFLPNIADVFGISLYNLFAPFGNSTVDALSLTYSGIQARSAFANGSTPMPILMVVEVVPPGLANASALVSTPNGTIYIPQNDSITAYEFTPFWFGSWTGRVRGFTDLAYFGTRLVDGQPANPNACIQGYDTMSFVLGLCDSAMNFWFASSQTNGTVGQFARRRLHAPDRHAKRDSIPYPANEDSLEQLRVLGQEESELALLPEIVALLGQNLTDVIYGKAVNPFYNYSVGADGGAASQTELWLADGSETYQENPIWPLLQPARKTDFIIVSDNGGTELSSGWMNGTSFVNTAKLATLAGLPFPRVPDVNTMLNLNHTSRPVLYGCNEPAVPLILYAADFPYSAYTNISFSVSALSGAQVTALTANGLALLSQNASALAPGWTACIACAVVERSLARARLARPAACDTCFAEHCWNGTVVEAAPAFLEPSLVLDPALSFDVWNATVFNGGGSV